MSSKDKVATDHSSAHILHYTSTMDIHCVYTLYIIIINVGWMEFSNISVSRITSFSSSFSEDWRIGCSVLFFNLHSFTTCLFSPSPAWFSLLLPIFFWPRAFSSFPSFSPPPRPALPCLVALSQSHIILHFFCSAGMTVAFFLMAHKCLTHSPSGYLLDVATTAQKAAKT